ncbi:MAG: SoxR reducing system RseC family protein [Treponemataceae bacterium]|nr:SoxR reducing system RseC family protein [Treponemataceae bacterium]
MQDNVVIVSIKGSEILVVPMLTGACINCERSSCAKKGKPFSVSNPDSLDVHVGSIVKIRANNTIKIIQGFAALFIPIIFAVGFYFLGGFIALKTGSVNTEIYKAGFSLLGLILSSLTVFLINAKSHKLQHSEICEIVA